MAGHLKNKYIFFLLKKQASRPAGGRICVPMKNPYLYFDNSFCYAGRLLGYFSGVTPRGPVGAGPAATVRAGYGRVGAAAGPEP